MNYTHWTTTDADLDPVSLPELLHQSALYLGPLQHAWDLLIRRKRHPARSSGTDTSPEASKKKNKKKKTKK